MWAAGLDEVDRTVEVDVAIRRQAQSISRLEAVTLQNLLAVGHHLVDPFGLLVIHQDPLGLGKDLRPGSVRLSPGRWHSRDTGATDL